MVLDRELHKGYNGEIWEGESEIMVEQFDDDLDDDEDDEEDIEVEEEEIPSEDDLSIKVPEFIDASTKPSAFEMDSLQVLEKLDQDVILKEYDHDHILWKMHYDRIALTEKHVMWARKQNLYNETFNTESMADVLWSHQM